MTKQVIKRNRKPRGPAAVRVGPNTEWTDSYGMLELFGIRRSLLYHLTERGHLVSSSLKDEGEKRGKRLWHVPTARRYFNSFLPAEGGVR